MRITTVCHHLGIDSFHYCMSFSVILDLGFDDQLTVEMYM